ncbi:MAG: MFS transporter [Gammaproteobacteria bacterium]|nr:MAG: MFS transporter [Gammaproteobacteria bacterium]UTW43723.1 MFS transporter [bacterium SCSIO 12844]
MSYQAQLKTQNLTFGWIVVVVASLIFFFEFGLGVVFNSLASYISESYQIKITTVSLISSLYFYTNILFLIPAGILIDRYSAKVCMISALSLCALSAFTIAFSHSITLLIIARLLTGAASSFCLISVVRVATNWFPSERMGLVIGVAIAIGMLGGWFAQAPLSYLIDIFGWRDALKIVGLIGVGIIILIFYIVSNTPKALQDLRKEQQTEVKNYSILKMLKLALKKPQNWFAAIYTGLINVGTWMLGGMWANAYLGHVYGVSQLNAAYVTGFMFFGMVIGYPFWGGVTQWLKRRKLPMLMGSIASLVVVLLLMNASSNLMYLAILFFALGFVTSSQTVAYPYVGEINTMLVTSSATSVVSMMSLLWGGVIGMPLFGYLMSAYANTHHVPLQSMGTYQFAIWIIPIAFILSFLFALLTKETYCVRQVD